MAAKHNHHKAQSWRTARGKGATGRRDREEGGGGSKSEEEEERPANTAEVRSELRGGSAFQTCQAPDTVKHQPCSLHVQLCSSDRAESGRTLLYSTVKTL